MPSGWSNDYGDVPRWWWAVGASAGDAAIYTGELLRAARMRETVAALFPGDRDALRDVDAALEARARVHRRPHPMRALLLAAMLSIG